MIVIPLLTEPNQSLSVTLDGVDHALTLKEAGGVMVMTIVRDGVTILSNTRLLPGILINPYEHLEYGNFIFLTEDEELPYYTQFDRQQLLFVSPDELEQYR